MAYTWTKLPLFDEWDYEYTVVLEETSYTLRLYYSDRVKKWSIDIVLEDGAVLLEGETLLSEKITAEFIYPNLSGFFWLEPIGKDLNETISHPSLLPKYFNFYYIGV